MKKLTFEPTMDGRKRKALVKDKVNGYKHTETQGVHSFKRGKIIYIINARQEAVTLEKIDNSGARLNIEYDVFYKFIDIIV